MSETVEMSGYKEMLGHAAGFADSGKDRFLKTLAAVADDKLGYTPSEGAKTPLQIGAHVAVSNFGMADMIEGSFEMSPDMWEKMAAEEAKLDTQEKVVGAIEESHKRITGVINGLTVERFGETLQLGPTEMKVSEFIFYGGTHYFSHASQVDYIQTCYGDHEFYM